MAKKKEKKKTTVGDVIRTIVMLIALAVFVYSGFQLAMIFLEYKAGTDEYKGLREFVSEAEVKTEEELDVIEVTDEVDYPRLDVDFDALRAINEDVIGWIQVEAIEAISYPVVQGTDNDKYLKITYEGNQNGAGSIFMDYENKADFTDENTFIYGHNMRNGSMFGSLKDFHEEATYDKNPYIWIYTPEKDYRYEIFSYHVVGVTDDSFIKFYNSTEEFQEYLNRVKSMSEYETGVSVDARERIITLSTCTGNDTTRFLVHAKLVLSLAH